jgi:hypothetical protein
MNLAIAIVSFHSFAFIAITFHFILFFRFTHNGGSIL